MIKSNSALFENLDIPNGRRWVIGDVHGHRQSLEALVSEQIKLQKEDHLILLGDLVDRGPDVKGVVDYLESLRKDGFQVWVLKGNHEELLLKSREEEKSVAGKGFWFLKPKKPLFQQWLGLGGQSTLASFGVRSPGEIPSAYINYFEQCLHFISYPDSILVHAGINFSAEEPFEDTQAMLWIRDYEVEPNRMGGRLLIHGHTPVDLDFIQEQVRNHKDYGFIGLDNGIGKAGSQGFGRLLAMEIGSKQLLIQKNVDNGASNLTMGSL